MKKIFWKIHNAESQCLQNFSYFGLKVIIVSDFKF